jgi:hypothetical protein
VGYNSIENHIILDPFSKMTNKHDIDKAYISPYDKFFYEFDKTHTPSPSQLAERKKHKDIAYLRDTALTNKDKENIWQEF